VGIGVASVLVAAASWSLLTSSNGNSNGATCPKSRGDTGRGPGTGVASPGAGESCTGESCPWQYVLSDLTNRLHLLEMAFKEQVVAREVIAQEVSNQSDSNLMIEQKLLAFLRRLDEVENLVRRVENRQQELSARLYSDEFIGFMVILAIMVEVLLRVRPRVGQFRPWGVAHQLNINGVSFSPKHGLFLKPELCVVAFRKDHTALTNFIDSTLRHLDDVKLSVRPYYVIESQDHLRQCPRAKLYLVIFEMEERVSSGPRHQDSDLITSTVRYIKSLGATIVLIVTNDEGSKRLTVHALYNTHLRLLQSHEAFQDLTSSGRVFSAWRELTSHQISHMRKIVKTALSLKTSIR
ncbi:hypothetical protein BaRGS_00021013, partial [Batillaria attramentaria]